MWLIGKILISCTTDTGKKNKQTKKIMDHIWVLKVQISLPLSFTTRTVRLEKVLGTLTLKTDPSLTSKKKKNCKRLVSFLCYFSSFLPWSQKRKEKMWNSWKKGMSRTYYGSYHWKRGEEKRGGREWEEMGKGDWNRFWALSLWSL